jgi:hypothetical protein
MDDVETRLAILERNTRHIDVTLDRIDTRLDRLETRIDRVDANMRADFRWIMGLMISGLGATLTGFAAMFALMAHGFHWIP